MTSNTAASQVRAKPEPPPHMPWSSFGLVDWLKARAYALAIFLSIFTAFLVLSVIPITGLAPRRVWLEAPVAILAFLGSLTCAIDFTRFLSKRLGQTFSEALEQKNQALSDQLQLKRLSLQEEFARDLQEIREAYIVLSEKLTSTQPKLSPELDQVFLPDHGDTLGRLIIARLDPTVDRETLRELSDRISYLEWSLKGRLGMPIEGAAIQTLVTSAVSKPAPDVLVVDTPAGIEMAVINDYLRDRSRYPQFTAITRGICTTDVTDQEQANSASLREAQIRWNLSEAGLDTDRYELVEHRDTDNGLFGKYFDVLIINNAHARVDLKADLSTYGPLVKSGGFLLVSHYNALTNPEIKGLADVYLKNEPGLTFVIAIGTVAVFRVIGKIELSAWGPEPAQAT